MHSKSTPTYNGWSNYETWAVNLWLTNEQASDSYWRERTGEILAESAEDEDRESALGKLAGEIRDAVEESCSIEGASLASDLMTAALGEVDWHEIAQSWLDDAAPEPTPQKVVPLGTIRATPGALERVDHEARLAALARHARGDWGDVDPEDWAENELSLAEGFRLLSVYHSADVKFWIITEADRSATTILLPSEY